MFYSMTLMVQKESSQRDVNDNNGSKNVQRERTRRTEVNNDKRSTKMSMVKVTQRTVTMLTTIRSTMTILVKERTGKVND